MSWRSTPSLAAFYGRTQWTQIDWEQRQRLRGSKSLALWLHGFYASHAAPYPLTVEPICTNSAAAGPSN